jgi:pyridoxine 5-phosphate synthase
MQKLGVNIDHVATLRQARYRLNPDAPQVEPDILLAAVEAVTGGADSITVHLREDRRHIVDADVGLLKRELKVPLNLEMGLSGGIVEIALATAADYACLVPEHRQEVTTEGGLDVGARLEEIKDVIERLRGRGTRVSLFIDPEEAQVRAAAEAGADMIELHTGAFANHVGEKRAAEVARLVAGAQLAHSLGLQVNAGHGLTAQNLPDLAPVPHLVELNVGHHLVSRALTVGLRAAVAEFKAVMSGLA